jgi:hypothetical protein
MERTTSTTVKGYTVEKKCNAYSKYPKKKTPFQMMPASSRFIFVCYNDVVPCRIYHIFLSIAFYLGELIKSGQAK